MRPGCGWSYVPESAGWEFLEFHPWDFMPMPAWGQDNPPLLVPYNPALNWFTTAIEFPQSVAGGSWVQCSFLTPPDVDPTVLPEFQLYWATSLVAGGNVRFDVHMTANADGTALAPGGPGTAVNDTTAGNDLVQITDPVAIAATGGGTWGASQACNVNIYRGVAAANDIAAPVYMFGLIARFRRL